MATVSTSPPSALQAVPITSVQPGGGTGMKIELAWGRFRRSMLRRFFSSYVARMAAVRQGTCPDCPHDIIDSRDLKFYRNVCGFSFRPEDDLYRYRDHLRLARMGLAELICFSIGLGLVTVLFAVLALAVHGLFAVPLIGVLVFWGFIISFFRDPDRIIPDAADALVSPADGTITHIDEVTEPDFPGGRAFRISIFLSVLNVHVNRLPRSGKVASVRYYPGAFLDARHPQCGVANEQLWLDLDDSLTGKRLRLKQISGKLARRIVCWLRPGEEVQRGDRFGMIKFGSRTEIYLPLDAGVAVEVKIGDTVKGGNTILLRFKTEVPKT